MKKLIAIVLIALLIPTPVANATTHHSYKNKGWKHHKLSGTSQSRYLHAISHSRKKH